MLKAHMNAVENSLIQISQIPSNSGHTLHKGTPREAFIKEFLEKHLSSNVSIGTGEIIDANSQPKQARNQFDIVIYKNSYPKLDFGGGINAFLVESVIATIEVKSILDSSAIDQSIRAAHNVKNLTPSIDRAFSTGWIPPKPLNIVVAYSGPASMSTAHTWIINSHRNNTIPFPVLTPSNRTTIAGTALDAVFVLKSGFIKLDNTPLSLNQPQGSTSNHTHIISDTADGNLLMLFMILQEACNNIEGAWLNPSPYLASVNYPNVSFR